MTARITLPSATEWSELIQSSHAHVLLVLGAFTVIAPFLCLVVRWGRKGNIAWVLGAFPLSVITLSVVLAAARRDLLLDYLRLVIAIAAPFEIGFVLWILFTTLRTVRSFSMDRATGDFFARIDAAARQASGLDRLGGIVAAEISALYYGLFSWRARPAVSASSQAFSYTESGGYGAALPSFIAFIVVETGAVHFLVSLRFPNLAWLLTALGGYAIIWIFADHRAVQLRPILLSKDTLLVRAGVRGTVSVPIVQVEAVRAGTASPRAPDLARYRQMSLLGPPDFVVELKISAVAHGFLASKKSVTSIGFCVDDPGAFAAALGEAGVTVTGEPDDAPRDFVDRLRAGLRRVLRKNSIADALTHELALIAYVCSFRRLGRLPSRDQGKAAKRREFTIFRESGLGAVVTALIVASTSELFVVELLVREKSALLANVLLMFGGYGALWFFGDFRAVKLRPFVVDDESLWVRVGLRKEGRIPLSDIEEITSVTEEPRRRQNRAYIRCTAFGPPRLMIRLRTPARFDRMVGGTRTASLVGITTDDDANFVNEVRSRMDRIACG